ncbi:MAG: TVP38/TMEM64 family protein [Candidatus Nanohaloarchaea archaeon]
MQVFSSRRRKVEAAILISTVFAAGGLGYNFFSSSIALEPGKLAAAIGPYGPPGVILLQFAQVLIAPLPPITPVISGMLYGVGAGTIYSMVGAAAGSLAAILIARRYGRTAVKKFLSEEAMERFDSYTSGHGYLPFIVLFVFPGFPDDALCFIAGLTRLDWKKLFLIGWLGRLPGIALLAMTGSSAAQANTFMFVLSGGAVAIISYVSVRYERELEKMVEYVEKEGVTLFDAVWPR